jgi:hypothetical protein
MTIAYVCPGCRRLSSHCPGLVTCRGNSSATFLLRPDGEVEIPEWEIAARRPRKRRRL